TVARLLLKQRPNFAFFSDADRTLASDYSLPQAVANLPPALANFCALAELNLDQLLQAIRTADVGKVATIKAAANRRLKERLSAWSQMPSLTVAIDTSGEMLQILTYSATNIYAPLAEKSDGLRQFLALLSFVNRSPSSTQPILLIDEVEAHLHYDAQADL